MFFLSSWSWRERDPLIRWNKNSVSVFFRGAVRRLRCRSCRPYEKRARRTGTGPSDRIGEVTVLIYRSPTRIFFKVAAIPSTGRAAEPSGRTPASSVSRRARVCTRDGTCRARCSRTAFSSRSCSILVEMRSTIVPPSYRIPQPFLPPTLGKNLSFRDEPDDYSFLRFFLEISRRSVARNEKQGSFSSSISLFLYTKYHTRDIVLARTREREREKERKRRGESWKGAGETVARRSRWTERCPACATGDEADLEEQSWRDPRAAALYRPRRPTTATKRARR